MDTRLSCANPAQCPDSGARAPISEQHAKVCAAQERATDALAALRVALEQDPAHAAALRRMAAVQLRQLGDIAASEATMRQAARVMRAQRPGGGAPGPGSR